MNYGALGAAGALVLTSGGVGVELSCLQPVNSAVATRANIATIENNFFIAGLSSVTANRRTSFFLGGVAN